MERCIIGKIVVINRDGVCDFVLRIIAKQLEYEMNSYYSFENAFEQISKTHEDVDAIIINGRMQGINEFMSRVDNLKISAQKIVLADHNEDQFEGLHIPIVRKEKLLSDCVKNLMKKGSRHSKYRRYK